MVEELAERFGDIANGQSGKKVASKVASNSKTKNEETLAACVNACRKAG